MSYPLRLPRWLQHEVEEPDDWSGYTSDLDDEEPPERDEEYEDWLDDFDRRYDDMYSDRTELPDGDGPPF